MKKIFSLILVFFFSLIRFVYADNKREINIETDKKEINLSDDLELKIVLKQKQDSSVDLSSLKIDWISNFDIIWQSSSTSMQIINNDVKSISSITYELKAKKTWDFVLWPASIQIWNNLYKTESLKINVLDTKNLSNLELKEATNSGNSYILYYILSFLIIFIIWLFINYNIFIKNHKKVLQNFWKIEKFSLDLDVNDSNFEEKIDEFIRKYINKKYDIKIDSHTYKEIFEILSKNNLEKENLQVIDKIFSFLIVNKYSTNKIWNREEIIKNIKTLE